MAKKKRFNPKGFESSGTSFTDADGHIRRDVSANIYHSMLQSKAYKGLSDRQRCLYVVCKAQYYGTRKPGRDYPDVPELQDDDLFYLNWALVQRYGLYTETMHSNFYDDMGALVEAGLIDRVASGKAAHTKSVYRYSSRWTE